MTEIDEQSTIGEVFFRTAAACAQHPMLAVPANPSAPNGNEISFDPDPISLPLRS